MDKTLLITGTSLILLPIVLYAAKSHWQFLNAPAEFLFSTGQKLDTKLTGITSEAEYMEFAKHAKPPRPRAVGCRP